MNTRKQRIEAVFDAAIELNSPDQREVYLVKACGDDRQLLQEIEELLHAYEKAGGFLAANSTESGKRFPPDTAGDPAHRRSWHRDRQIQAARKAG